MKLELNKEIIFDPKGDYFYVLTGSVEAFFDSVEKHDVTQSE